MTQEQLINQFCEFRGKCTTDDVVALNFAYEMLAPRWISVEDELPKINPNDNVWEYSDDVIVALKDGSIAVGRYERDNSTSEHYWVLYGVDKDLIGTHWMPLPQPPKGGTQ